MRLASLILLLLTAPASAGINDLIALETKVQGVDGSTVTLGDVTGLVAGDRIIIESTHGYGEAGLDGVFKLSGAPANFYYTDVPIGKSFFGTVKAVKDKAVTVDRAVPAAALGKTVYRDNWAAVKYAIENKVAWPDKQRFACSMDPAPIRALLTDEPAEIDFRGCEIFAPRGCQAMRLSIGRKGGGGVSNKVYKNLTIRGNVRTSGYGLCIETGVYYQGNACIPAFSASGAGGPGGNIATNVTISGFRCIDNWSAIGVTLADGVVVKDCVAEFTDQQMHYVGWEFQAASAKNVQFINCKVNTDYVRPGFEAFKSTGVVFRDCGGRNTCFSSNASGDILFDRASVVWDQENPNPSFSPNNPLMNINRNIEVQNPGGPKYPSGGIRVRNFAVEYRKLPYAGRIYNTIAISPSAGADIRGVSLKVPRTDLTTPNSGYLVRSDDADSLASGLVGALNTGAPYVKQNKAIPADPVQTIKVELLPDEWDAVISAVEKIKAQREGQ